MNIDIGQSNDKLDSPYWLYYKCSNCGNFYAVAADTPTRQAVEAVKKKEDVFLVGTYQKGTFGYLENNIIIKTVSCTIKDYPKLVGVRVSLFNCTGRL